MIRWLVTGALAAGLAGVLAWEVTSSDTGGDTLVPALRPEATAPRPVSPFDAAPVAAAAATALARPLFSRDRRPPAERVPAVAPPADESLARLTGIVIGPAGRRAIFAGADGRSRALAEGGRIGPFTVKTINPGQVTVTSTEGDRVLRPSFAKAQAAGSTAPAPPVQRP